MISNDPDQQVERGLKWTFIFVIIVLFASLSSCTFEESTANVQGTRSLGVNGETVISYTLERVVNKIEPTDNMGICYYGLTSGEVLTAPCDLFGIYDQISFKKVGSNPLAVHPGQRDLNGISTFENLKDTLNNE